MLLTTRFFELRALETYTLEGNETTLLNRIRLDNHYDNLVVKALSTLTPGNHCPNEWEQQDGIILYQGCVYVPMNPQLCHDLVHAHHNSHTTGHLGHWKTLELISQNYWWPGLSHYVAKFVAGCDMCQ